MKIKKFLGIGSSTRRKVDGMTLLTENGPLRLKPTPERKPSWAWPTPFVALAVVVAIFVGIVIGRATLMDETNDELNEAWARTYDAEADSRALFNLLDYKCAEGAAAELQPYSGLINPNGYFAGSVLVICEPAQGYDPAMLKRFLCDSSTDATLRLRRYGMC